MELVIKIPDKIYEHKTYPWNPNFTGSLIECIENGTPLPKGHDRLLQQKDVIKSLFDYVDNKKTIGQCLQDTKAIIEADKEQEE